MNKGEAMTANDRLDAAMLKPCPFCGETPSVRPIEGMYHIGCFNRECETQPAQRKAFFSAERAILAWNRRPV